MADEGQGPVASGEPLKASVVEQLREKAHLEEESQREREAAQRQESTIERLKQEERHVVARHGGDSGTFRAAREAARRQPVRGPQLSVGTLALLVLGVAFLVRLVAPRRR